jgi:crotonobetainyl-CoA:carnitine CoA-transferase CaiB-like acyl-CoA transferase
MASKLLEGVRVVDLAGEPAAMTGRILADLGADVVHVEPPGGDPLRRTPPLAGDRSLVFEAWNAGERGLVCADDDPRFSRLLADAQLVLATPGWPGVHDVAPARAPHASFVRVTPFGGEGPRSGWRASDLGVMASSGNMYSTGFPDRAPIRSSQPCAYAHTGPEAALAALTALASGRPQVVDVSMQEAVMLANMSGSTLFARQGQRGQRPGASMGRTREVHRCKDGFVTFGLRGGPARVPSLRIITKLLVENGLDTPAWTERDFAAWNPNETSDEEMKALEAPLAALFARYTVSELFAIACDTNLMLAAVNTPHEIYASPQLEARGLFGRVGSIDGFPLRFAAVRSADGETAPIEASRPAPRLDVDDAPDWSPAATALGSASAASAGPAWEGLKLVEFGSGAAGPIATRYFAEHGATVVKVESRSRPDFLRIYALGPGNPHGLEGSPLFTALNVGKRSITLDLKNAEGQALARRLILWADAVLENFAPRAMRGFGLDYETLARERPDLVMISSCMNGQTGPQRNYPGFGAQGAALSCWNFVTGWPDREPIGPYGTITDSLSPRFAAVAIAAAVLHRRRTGRGAHVDLSQVETALYTLSPWLLDYAQNGIVTGRMGNRSPRAAPHGAFPCREEGEIGDRWVAIAVWDDAEWAALTEHAGIQAPELAKLEARLARVDEVEARVSAWTRTRTRQEVTDALQTLGIEAVPVQDFADLMDDPQLAARGHFVSLEHPALGDTLYERNGFRLSDAPQGYTSPTPTLGQHDEEVLRTLLGLSASERTALAAAGAVESGSSE